jgi:hypothetical protein
VVVHRDVPPDRPPGSAVKSRSAGALRWARQASSCSRRWSPTTRS